MRHWRVVIAGILASSLPTACILDWAPGLIADGGVDGGTDSAVSACPQPLPLVLQDASCPAWPTLGDGRLYWIDGCAQNAIVGVGICGDGFAVVVADAGVDALALSQQLAFASGRLFYVTTSLTLVAVASDGGATSTIAQGALTVTSDGQNAYYLALIDGGASVAQVAPDGGVTQQASLVNAPSANQLVAIEGSAYWIGVGDGGVTPIMYENDQLAGFADVSAVDILGTSGAWILWAHSVPPTGPVVAGGFFRGGIGNFGPVSVLGGAPAVWLAGDGVHFFAATALPAPFASQGGVTWGSMAPDAASMPLALGNNTAGLAVSGIVADNGGVYVGFTGTDEGGASVGAFLERYPLPTQ